MAKDHRASVAILHPLSSILALSYRTSVLILALATIVTLGRVCGYGFTNAEDQGLITRNPNLNPPTLAGLWNHWRHPHIGLYIPVTYTAWWALAQLGQTSVPDETGSVLNSWIFRTFNLALHVASPLIHLLLVIGIIVLIWNFVAGRRAV